MEKAKRHSSTAVTTNMTTTSKDQILSLSSTSLSSRASNPLRFRWLDAGIPQPDGSFHFHSLEVITDPQNNNLNDYINNGGLNPSFLSPVVIKEGSTILLRNISHQSNSTSSSRHQPPEVDLKKEARGEEYREEDTEKYYGVATERCAWYAARVEHMYEAAPLSRRSQQEAVESRMKIRARWFLTKSDLRSLDLNFEGPITLGDVLTNTPTDDELILTNLIDENQVGAMIGPCEVVYRRPDPDDIPPGKLTFDSFVCRYQLEFKNDTPKTATVIPFDGKEGDWDAVLQEEGEDEVENDEEENDDDDNDDLEDEDGEEVEENVVDKDMEDGDDTDDEERDESLRTNKKPRLDKNSSPLESDAIESSDEHGGGTSNTNTLSSDDDGLSVSSAEYRRGGAPEAEGSTTEGSIKVGPAYQAIVPNSSVGQKVIPRNAVLVWKPDNAITDDILHNYFDKAANILIQYLEQNGLTSEEPYSPLTAEDTERFIITEGRNKLMTLSSVSTASSMSSKKNRLLRECCVDSLLELLQSNLKNVDNALAAIEAKPQDFVTGWTKSEKDVFDTRFRCYAGQLRMIGKNLLANKSFKEVVDYYYRFKIPDQYRYYQEQKLEQAVRMVECIENRRTYDCIIRDRPPSAAGSKSKAAMEWSRLGTTDVIGAVEARRASAKELLLEVRSVMGHAKMAEVADAIRSLSQHSSSDLRYGLADILQDQPDLLEKFLVFLPKRHRT